MFFYHFSLFSELIFVFTTCFQLIGSFSQCIRAKLWYTLSPQRETDLNLDLDGKNLFAAINLNGFNWTTQKQDI